VSASGGVVTTGGSGVGGFASAGATEAAGSGVFSMGSGVGAGSGGTVGSIVGAAVGAAVGVASGARLEPPQAAFATRAVAHPKSRSVRDSLRIEVDLTSWKPPQASCRIALRSGARC
jgi:hypothetical protein